MMLTQLAFVMPLVVVATAFQFSVNPTSDMSADEKSLMKGNRTMEQSDESGHEVETDLEEKDKKFLDDAMKTILDPHSIILKNDDIDYFKIKLDELDKENVTIDTFMEEMDKLSLDVCKTSQQALWSYVTDINNQNKKNRMVRVAAEEDEIKKEYWNLFKKKYFSDDEYANDPKFSRKLRIIKERGTNVQMPQNKQREEIDTMQQIWSRVTLCAYNTSCTSEDSSRTIVDVIAVFKTSNDSKELAYYWKTYRDSTGKKIRPIFKDYVSRMNSVAMSENFTDAGDMWRYTFEDDNFTQSVDRIWGEIKPLYNLLHDFVRSKLKVIYPEDLQDNDNHIPAHILGNLWAQEWQSVYPKVTTYPEYIHTKVLDDQSIHSKQLFDAVDEFHQSIGFESASDSYENIKETMPTTNCLPSSHDMCDGVHYKIKWCGEKVTDVVLGLSRAARLLGHIQYFKHYRNQPPLFRDGPNPAFHDAISEIVAVQLTSPVSLKNLGFIRADVGPEVSINHLLWMALEKFPMMAYAYVLDKWRWDVFGNSSLENWNQHWWDLRIKETGISPPVPRNETDLDPAAKYHVVSHIRYITYLVSHVLEFQILRSLCRQANHTGPLHECSIHGVKQAGKLLSDGMSLGASKNWRQVLAAMTGETELCTKGILEYFSPLEQFLKAQNAKLRNAEADDMDASVPIIVGSVVLLLTLLIIVLYCVKKHNMGSKVLSVCGLSKNGSLDIVTNEFPRGKNNETSGISEEKV